MTKPNTLAKISTYKDIITLLFKHLPGLSDSRLDLQSRFEVDVEVEPNSDATAFVDDLEELGPTFIKLGQLLSTRVDLLPPGYIAALQRLQDDVETVPYETIERTIKDQLGSKISQLFSSFEETPVASASIGQVHRAVLRDGETKVVVKVQRPNIREDMVRELDAIYEIAEYLQDHTDFGRAYDTARVVRQFREAILAELDYSKEQRNLVRLGEILKDSPNIVVPSPIESYCSPKVITMELMDGTRITDISGVVMAEIDGDALAEELFHAYLKQITVDGFFHADPHPGNILLTRDRKLALIDLGMVGRVSDKLQDQLIQFLGAVAEGHSSTAARIAIEMGTPREDFRPDEFERVIMDIVLSRRDTPVQDLRVGGLVMKVIEACGKNGLRIPDAVYMIGKMLLNIDLIGETLSPSFNPDESIRRHFGHLARKRMLDELTGPNLIKHLTEVKELFLETPERLNRALETVARNNLSIQVRGIDETRILIGFHRVANRITVGLILSALIVGASMLMRVESKFTIFGYPGLAMVFFLISAIGGIALVGKIIFGDEKTD
ncbi:MAG: AarF/UbiB family protein [Verrucomicrobiales bacterium]|nr:AarF/UbiB family protein [Verrucomicrobiales bacterium]